MNSIGATSKTFRGCKTYFLHLWLTKYSSTAAVLGSNFQIPNRIPRGPTDILKALEKTVNYDLTGPNYKYFDDPNLVPYNERQARMYALAKNAGRKAARWVRDEHPELFTQVMSDPPVLSYMPSLPINADTVSEDMLFQKICNSEVSDAIKVYEAMEEKNMDVSEETKLALLELLCFYNCDDPLPMDNIAERYYGQRAARKDYSVNAWRDHPVVKSLFNSLQHLGSRPYSALICGLFNANAKAEGDKLLQEAKDKKIQLDVNVYNALIMRTISVYDKGDVKRDMVTDILKQMQSDGVKPNLGTLNAAMDSISRLVFKEKCDFLVKLIIEFNNEGITPSPGTFAIFARGLIGKNRQDYNLKPFLSSVLKSFKGQSLELRHISDVLFFDWIMKACVVCESLPLAIECLELFLHSKNRRFCDGYKTTTFYNNFFQVLSNEGDYDTLVKYYRSLVPHAHTASPDFYTVLFEACDVNASIKEFPEFWKHYMGTGSLNETTVMKMLEVGVNLTALPDPEALEVRPTIGKLADKLIVFKMESERDRLFERVPLTSEMCNLTMILLARAVHWRTIQTVLKYMSEKDMAVDEKVVSIILDNCYDHGNPNMAVWVLKYCQSTFGSKLHLQPMASNLMNSDFLSKEMKGELKEIFNDDYSSSSSDGSSESESSDSDEDSSDSEDISVPRKKKPDVLKPDITKVIK